MLLGKLPNQDEYDLYISKLRNYRDLPRELKNNSNTKRNSSMDVLRTGTSMLGNLEPEGDLVIKMIQLMNSCCYAQ